MADLLVKHLVEKGKEHSALAMLVNQWGFDEQLIPKALQTIGSLFPHYSRHDESHSKQILINIERLLGDNLKLLTATDTWLLLEAAYWHDIGMVVPQRDLEGALIDKDFHQYIDNIRDNPNHELHNFCKSFDVNNMSNCFNGAATPVQAADQLRQLMSEWFRRRHAQRANTIIQSPWVSAGINSPRTELIPARLFRVLGRICQMHGAPFKQIVANEGLPFREAGLAQEDCHPRFVACLLRMGDLLDLDDNRFCPVMQRIAGEARPKLTKAHEDKHSSIRHLRIDREYIEIDAECDSIDGYVEAFKWFDWLKQEMQDQMANWQRIVPSRELGLLPTLGRISVRLSGKLQVLSEGNRPQFTIDAERAKELLQGSNLYNSQYPSVRELLQNSVDATLLRLWLMTGEDNNNPDWQTPFSQAAQNLLRSSRVKVAFHEIGLTSNPGKSNWELTITDEGTGISRADLIHMLKIGGSQGNIERQKKISSMPEWMKPSGVFGIGFQSVFLLADSVTLTTKSIFSSEVLQVVLHSPTNDKEGLVLLQQLNDDVLHPYGTKLTLNLALSTNRSPYVSTDDGNSISQRFARSYDPLLDEPIAMEAARLADKIFEFAKYSPIKIEGTVKTADGKHCIYIDGGDVNDKSPLGHWRFIRIDGYHLRLRYRPDTATFLLKPNKHFYYRGQSFTAYLHLPFMELEVDLLSGKAGSWLNASRDGLAPKAARIFSDLAVLALQKIIANELNSSTNCGAMNEEDRAKLSFFLERTALERGGEWGNLARMLNGAWLKLPCSENSTLEDYLDKDEIALKVTSYGALLSSRGGANLSLDKSLVEFFLKEWRRRPNRTISILDPASFGKLDEFSDEFYSLKSEPQANYDEASLAAYLLLASRKTYSNTRYILRVSDDRWAPLFLKKDVELDAPEVFQVKFEGSKRLILPFLFKASIEDGAPELVEVVSLDRLCTWVQPLLQESSEIGDIKKAYQELIFYIDEEVMKKSSYGAKWLQRRVN